AAGIRAIAAHGELAPTARLHGAVDIGPSRVAAEPAHRRPVRHRRRRRTLVVSSKLAGAVDHLAADHGEVRCSVGDLVVWAGKVITIGDDEIRRLADLNASLPAFLVAEP